jgi:hypothetical protein
MPDHHAQKAAAFIVQVLDLPSIPDDLASEIVSLKRESNSGVSSIELDSTVGPAAFLIYDYQLPVVDAGGTYGKAKFEADLKTLERAAELDTPGPRILAHATTDGEAFILATTPAVHRALTGFVDASDLEATEGDLLPGAETYQIRQDAASELMDILRNADQVADRWLRSIQSEGRLTPESAGEDFLDFGEAEAALALYLLDDRSIRHLLRALNLFVASARAQASDAIEGRDA